VLARYFLEGPAVKSPTPIAAEIVVDAYLQSDGSPSKVHVALYANGDIAFTRADIKARIAHTAIQACE
jgi:hypothetical protein